MGVQQAYEEKLKTKPTGRPIQFSKAKVKTLPKAISKMAKPSNLNTSKYSRLTHQKLAGAAKAAPAFKNPMPPAKQPTTSKLGKPNA
jgi:hypothetical protein